MNNNNFDYGYGKFDGIKYTCDKLIQVLSNYRKKTLTYHRIRAYLKYFETTIIQGKTDYISRLNQQYSLDYIEGFYHGISLIISDIDYDAIFDKESHSTCSITVDLAYRYLFDIRYQAVENYKYFRDYQKALLELYQYQLSLSTK